MVARVMQGLDHAALLIASGSMHSSRLSKGHLTTESA